MDFDLPYLWGGFLASLLPSSRLFETIFPPAHSFVLFCLVLLWLAPLFSAVLALGLVGGYVWGGGVRGRSQTMCLFSLGVGLWYRLDP